MLPTIIIIIIIFECIDYTTGLEAEASYNKVVTRSDSFFYKVIPSQSSSVY